MNDKYNEYMASIQMEIIQLESMKFLYDKELKLANFAGHTLAKGEEFLEDAVNQIKSIKLW